jgi:hypothetical protein
MAVVGVYAEMSCGKRAPQEQGQIANHRDTGLTNFTAGSLVGVVVACISMGDGAPCDPGVPTEN